MSYLSEPPISMRPTAPARESHFACQYSSSDAHNLFKDFASVLGGSDQALILQFPVSRGQTSIVIWILFFANDRPHILTNLLTSARYKDFGFIMGGEFYYGNAL